MPKRESRKKRPHPPSNIRVLHPHNWGLFKPKYKRYLYEHYQHKPPNPS